MSETTWTLTGKPNGDGACDHCDRWLKHRYEVTSNTGDTMIVGRGCLKTVTGWTLTAAQAARELRMIEVRKLRAERWAAFETSNPTEAATILSDCEAFAAMYDMHMVGGGAPHEIKLYVMDGDIERAPWLVPNYMARRHEFAWTR